MIGSLIILKFQYLLVQEITLNSNVQVIKHVQGIIKANYSKYQGD